MAASSWRGSGAPASLRACLAMRFLARSASRRLALEAGREGVGGMLACMPEWCARAWQGTTENPALRATGDGVLSEMRCIVRAHAMSLNNVAVRDEFDKANLRS